MIGDIYELTTTPLMSTIPHRATELYIPEMGIYLYRREDNVYIATTDGTRYEVAKHIKEIEVPEHIKDMIETATHMNHELSLWMRVVV